MAEDMKGNLMYLVNNEDDSGLSSSLHVTKNTPIEIYLQFQIGKCFRQRVSYLVHRRIHTGVMPYQCTACGKSFRYKVSERTHKCPSQPPGMIVRQAGELLQKLQEKAAAQVANQPTSTLDHQQNLAIVTPKLPSCSATVTPQCPSNSAQPQSAIHPTNQLPSCYGQQPRTAQTTHHASLNQQQMEPHVASSGLDQHSISRTAPMLLSASPSMHHIKGKCLELTQHNSTSCLLQQHQSNTPTIETPSLMNMTRQQLQRASSQFIVILDNNLQSSRNLLVSPTGVDMSSQTVQVSSPLPTGMDENIWRQQSNALTQKCGTDKTVDKSFSLSKVHQWSDSSFMDESSSVNETSKAERVYPSLEEKRRRLPTFNEGKKSETKRLDLELSETPDFFTVLENLPSPSERLRNLTISPSLKNLKTGEMKDIDEFSYRSTSNSPHASNRSQDALQTINEESLKQLLYGSSSGET